MNLPPANKDYTAEWLKILANAYDYTRTLAEQNWPVRFVKDAVQDAVLMHFEVPLDVDLDSEEVRKITAHSWGYYCMWYKKLYESQGQQLELFAG